MAKIDHLLEHMIVRGAPILRLDPGEVPVIELPEGQKHSLKGMELGGSMLDGFVREILPDPLRTPYFRGERVTFDYACHQESFRVLVRKTSQGTRLVIGRHSPGGASLPSAAAQGGPKLLDSLLSKLRNGGGSELYLNAGEPPIVRLDGRVELLEGVGEVSEGALEEMVRHLVPDWDQRSVQGGGSLEFAHEDQGLTCRMRLSHFQDASGPSLSIRLIPKEVPDAAALGLDETVQRLAHLSQGLVLLTGPMGSGKSTTLACLLDIANRERKDYIITLQDTPEFEFGKGGCLLRQRKVGRDPRNQKQAIQAALRQAPDILALGELQDAEVIELMLQAACSGRAVLATLQSTSLLDTFYRIVEAFPQERQAQVRYRLADCLKAVVGHTLLRRTAGGLTAAIETLFVNPAIADLIRSGKLEKIPAAMKNGRYGQTTHNDALVKLILDQTVDPLEAYLRCQDRESFISACKKAGIAFDPRSAGQVTVA
jgi:twitching motility protein PilT